MNQGLEIARPLGVEPKVIRAGHANLFKSAVFRETLTLLTGCKIELVETDGAMGAARGARSDSSC
jgi:xylulokinase